MKQMKEKISLIFFLSILLIGSCSSNSGKAESQDFLQKLEDHANKHITLEDIKIEKEFLYDQHSLEDKYPYKDTFRVFQWNKIKEYLFILDSIQSSPVRWAVLQNYKNIHGVPPLVNYSKKNEYNHDTDTFGIERYQSVPLFQSDDSVHVSRYVRDGALVEYGSDAGGFKKIKNLRFAGDWLVPNKYIQEISDTKVFRKAIFIDRTNQNIAVLEKVDSVWLVRSMNPATTGLHKPPHKYPTPTGIFTIQNKTRKMVYLADGTSNVGGFSPYANRFSGGAYIHGIPIDLPKTKEVEISSSLGTTPRSHMCVRNATSHAKFIYEWAPVYQTVVFVFD